MSSEKLKLNCDIFIADESAPDFDSLRKTRVTPFVPVKKQFSTIFDLDVWGLVDYEGTIQNRFEFTIELKRLKNDRQFRSNLIALFEALYPLSPAPKNLAHTTFHLNIARQFASRIEAMLTVDHKSEIGPAIESLVMQIEALAPHADRPAEISKGPGSLQWKSSS